MERTVTELVLDLDHHRSFIDALSEVDQLLLRSTELEPILEIVLPSIATVLGANSVSVFLLDGNSRKRARAYDHCVGDPVVRPVRRVAINAVAVAELLQSQTCWWATLQDPATATILEPLAILGSSIFQLYVLHNDQQVAGLLCIGHSDLVEREVTRESGAQEFAFRLSVVLANCHRTQQLNQEANYDALTGLPNRRYFRNQVTETLVRLRKDSAQGALLYIDLDHFKRINDTEGHTVGDAVLRLAARRISHCLKDSDTLGRLGGDEFAVFVPNLADESAARRIAERIIQCLQRPVTTGGREYFITASVGVTQFPADGDCIEALLKHSDIAMYRAKDSGRGRATFYMPEMQERMTARTKLESALQRAVKNEEFEVVYQPIARCGPLHTVGLEALLRWPEGPSDGDAKTPAVFIPIAEESALIVEIGDWVLHTACRQYSNWRRAGYALDYVSVNVSARQLRELSLLDRITRIIDEFGMRPHELQIEITENVLAHGGVTEQTLRDLAARGVRLALDDFGTGYSSLNYIRRFPIHSVKVDRSFVADLPKVTDACLLMESIIKMCSALGKHVVAEGVETTEQLQLIEALGCNEVQGYLIGRPMVAGDVPGILRRRGATEPLQLVQRAARIA
jgi:diguanylate cyclase (GGDEF)-like protein